MNRVPLKRLARIRVSNVDKKSAESEVPVRLCNYTDVYYRDEIAPDQEFMRATATPEQVAAFRLRPGDVIITKDSETAEDIGVPTYVRATASDLVCGYHLAIIRPEPTKLDGRFLYWFMSSTTAREQLAVAATGVTRFGLRAESTGAVCVPSWSLDRQRTIADYVDTETARIDALITKKETLSATLDSWWRRTLLQRLGVADAPADGAAPWVGRPIPDGWSLRPLRRLVTHSWGGDWGGDPGTGMADLDCVRAADFDFSSLQAVKGAPRAFDVNTLSSRVLRAGDMVLEKSGGGEGVPVGRVVAWRGAGDAVPTNFAAGLRPAIDADPDFVVLAFRAAYEVGLPWRSIKQTTGLQNLDLGHYLTHLWPVPDRQEQSRLAVELMYFLRQVRGIQNKFYAQLALLREHRQALITAAVTGELGIPGVA